MDQLRKPFVESGLAAKLDLLTDVAARDNASEAAFRINDRQQALLLAMVGTKRMLHFAERALCRESGNFCAHNFAREKELQRIDGIFAAQMVATSRNLFRKYGALQRQHCEGVGYHATNQ